MAQTEETAFPRLTSAELAVVKPLATPCDFGDGDVIFRAGQTAIDLYVVESGRMEIRNPTDGGRLIAVPLEARQREEHCNQNEDDRRHDSGPNGTF